MASVRLRWLVAVAALAWAALAACTGRAPEAGVPPGATSAAPRESFVVMSFNVRYGTADDGPDAWPLRRDDLLARIVEQRPALLGVQEALDFQVEWLERALPGHRRLGQGREGGSRGEHASLFVELARFDVLDHGDFWLSETPGEVASVGWDAALTRMCSWVRLRERASGREFTVWNTHFDHRGAQARERSAELIAARTLAQPGPHVVLGDLNAGERSAPLAALARAGLRDTYRDVHAEGPGAGTFHAFRGGSEGDKIDFVLASDGLATLDAAILAAPGARGRWPSDHHAVTARLALR